MSAIQVAETMHRHATIGPVSVQRCLGGEKGLFAAYLLSKTGIPCSTCTQLGTHRGAVTVAHAASSGLFSLRCVPMLITTPRASGSS